MAHARIQREEHARREVERAAAGAAPELESEMHVHVHLENNVLFPRALSRTRG